MSTTLNAKRPAGLAAATGSVDISKLPTEFRGCTWDDGWDFEAPCVIYHPKKLMRYAHGGNTGTLDDLVQDITYNLGEGLPPNDGGLEDDCKWRGWSKDGMRRRRDAWHVVFKGVWVNTEDGPEWHQTSRTETYGIPQNSEYPPDWPAIAERIKAAAGYKCERCGHKDDFESGHVLTTHHLDGDKSNCADWNLAALCQRCHLKIQGRVKMDQLFFEHLMPVSDWFRPHLEGYMKSKTP